MTTYATTSSGDATSVDAQLRATTVRVQAIRLVEKAYSEAGLTVTVLAARLHLSVRQLYRYFEGGESPADLLARTRTEQAVRLLQNHPKLRVDAVAKEVGLVDESTLRAHLRKLYDATPKEIRQGGRLEGTHG